MKSIESTADCELLYHFISFVTHSTLSALSSVYSAHGILRSPDE